MPPGFSGTAIERASELARSAAVVEAELVDDAEPSRKELILLGRASLATIDRNPDDWVDAETENMLNEAFSAKTVEAIEWAWGRFIWWCGKTGRKHDPATAATIRQWIKEHWTMAYPDGRLRGRRGQPYSPRTVELAVYLVSMVHAWFGWPNPVKHPKVRLQLRAYSKRYAKAGFVADQAYALTHDDSVALARSYPQTTMRGVRSAAAFRLQFDTGMRAAELVAMMLEHVTWERPADVAPDYAGPLNAVIRIPMSKTDQDAKGRSIGVEVVLDVDGDVDPAVLLARWIGLLREAGYTTGPVWHAVTSTLPRKDGAMSGRILPEQWTYNAYEDAFKRAGRRAGLDCDPGDGKPRQWTSHGNRAGHVTAALDAGRPVEQVAMRTGHAPTGSIHGYYRGRRRFGASNTGTSIRTTRRRVVR